ncbi:MAG: hypothetical protein AAGD14_03525 [Planctomycetota bacterium]
MRILILLTIFLAASWAHADEVYLKDGRVLSGVVVRKGSKIYVSDRDAQYVLRASEIKDKKGIVAGKSFMHEFEERLALLDDEDAEAIYEFGLWLEENEWASRARNAYERVIEIDEDHRGARRKLGYKKYEGEWVSPEELNRRKGLVQWEVDGKWYTKHDLAQIKAEIERNEKFRQQIEKQRKINKRVQGTLKKFATFDKKKRQKAYEELYAYAEELNSPELRKFADDTRAYYNQYVRTLCAQLKSQTQIQATQTKIKRPIDTFETNLGAAVGGIFPAQTPVRIQLPEIAIASVSTTVDIPAGCG